MNLFGLRDGNYANQKFQERAWVLRSRLCHEATEKASKYD